MMNPLCVMNESIFSIMQSSDTRRNADGNLTLGHEMRMKMARGRSIKVGANPASVAGRQSSFRRDTRDVFAERTR